MAEKEKIKKMTEFRGWLQKRMEELETELDGLRTLLEFTEASLVEKGFRRAEIGESHPTSPIAEAPSPHETTNSIPILEDQEAIPLKTATGDLLANLYITEDSMRIVPSENKGFNVNTPPFTSFLVERVLAKMQEKDRKAADAGELMLEEILSYNIARDGDNIQEVTIKNVRPERLQELKSTVRWTLEKMYEKMTQTSPG
jgi:hypothetical protein